MNASPSPRELWDSIPEPLWARCLCAGRAAEEAGQAVYLVGGFVRDLALGRPCGSDIDLVVEGDPGPMAEAVARGLGGTSRPVSQFMTRRVDLADGSHIDVAAARQETYPTPAKLPVVEPSDIADDLRRRDFSVNAIAAPLTGDGLGELIDPCAGRRDLLARVLRVLHGRSFVDDPTRIIRAARLAARLGFALDPDTDRRLHEAAAERLLEQVSGARVRDEVAKLMAEPDPRRALRRLHSVGALSQAVPGARLRDLESRWIEAVPRALAALGAAPGVEGRWPYVLGALGCHSAPRAVAARLRMDRRSTNVLLDMGYAAGRPMPRVLASLPPPDDPALDAALAGSPTAALVVYWLRADGRVCRRLEHYVHSVRGVRADISGRDLLERGAAPGPAIGVGLSAARRTRLAAHAGPAEQTEAALHAIARWRKPGKAGRPGQQRETP